MNNLAAELVANRKTIAQSDVQEKESYGVRVYPKTEAGIKRNLVTKRVAQNVARKSPEIAGLGKVSRKKTDVPNNFELFANGEKIGTAECIYKTKSQRSWNVTINGQSFTNLYTMADGIRAYGEQNA